MASRKASRAVTSTQSRTPTEVIYEQRERVFHRDIQIRENNGE